MAFFIGALVPAGIVTALLVWLTGRVLPHPATRAAVASIASLFVCTVVGAYGLADGGPPAFGAAFASYLLPQAVWAVVWLFVLVGRATAKKAG